MELRPQLDGELRLSSPLSVSGLELGLVKSAFASFDEADLEELAPLVEAIIAGPRFLLLLATLSSWGLGTEGRLGEALASGVRLPELAGGGVRDAELSFAARHLRLDADLFLDRPKLARLLLHRLSQLYQ